MEQIAAPIAVGAGVAERIAPDYSGRSGPAGDKVAPAYIRKYVIENVYAVLRSDRIIRVRRITDDIVLEIVACCGIVAC